MTRGEIIAKWDGITERERAAWVAEKVMGWTRKGFPGGGGGFIAWMDEHGAKAKLIEGGMGDYCATCQFFRPSIDLSAAWEVVEKLRPTHIYEMADFGRKTHPDKPHYAWFHYIGRGSRSPNEYQARAKTLPEAICLAALLAVMTE